MVSNQGRLVIMAKHPIPGTVKTRLIPALGAEGACKLYQAMLNDVMTAMAQGPWQTTVALSPHDSVDEFSATVPPGIDVIPQRGKNLTERMIQVFEQLLPESSPVIMRNSDSPDLPPETIETAFQELARDDIDVVFGPDLGGGYYLVGLKAPCPDLFRTAMSTSDNFEKTLARCSDLGLKVSVLEAHRDVDTPDDLYEIGNCKEHLQSSAPDTFQAMRILGLIS